MNCKVNALGASAAALFALGAVAFPAGSASAMSKAALYLIAEQIRDACSDGGQIESVIERDLNGDGKADLIIDHGLIGCRGGSPRSGFCGAQACSVMIYVREGNLLKLKVEALSVGVAVDEGNPPAIRLVAHGGEAFTLRWDGADFR